MSARLSPHFAVVEFRCRDGTPVPIAALPGLQRLCRGYLEPLRQRFGPVTVHSGYRTQAHNRTVGGAPHSRHLYHLRPREPAADVTCQRGTPRQWHRFLDELGAPGLGLYPGFVHVDVRVGRSRW
jgi:zinc D-Ala-D-Ala carboxypeptidase